MPFQDRVDAGKKLAAALAKYRGAKDAIVVALPRGGVVLGRVIADELGVPLDIIVPRKIGAPGNDEYAVGAVTESGHVVWNELERPRIDAAYAEAEVSKQKEEAARRLRLYRAGLPKRDLKGKTVILVDDGAATGYTIRAAIETARAVARPQMRYLSYYGLALAKMQGANFEALQACETSARRDFFNPDLLLNLGRVYLLAGKTTRALAAFERGLALAPTHPALNGEIAKHDRRKVPPISVLPRSHPINLWLGRARSSLASRARTMLPWRTVTPS